MAIVSGSWLLDLAAILLALFATLYLYFTRNSNFWMKKGIPFIKPKPFVGNIIDSFMGKRNVGFVLKDIYLQAKGKPYVGIFIVDQPMLVVRDVEIIRSILVKDFNYFMNRNFRPSEHADPLSYKGLFVLNGQPWKRLRMKLSPTFTSGKMKTMFQLVDACGLDLVDYMAKNIVNNRLEIKDTTARFTSDVIATCAFGIQGNALKEADNEFRRTLKRIFDFSLTKNFIALCMFFAPGIVSTFNLKMIDEDIADYVRGLIWGTVEYRKKNGIVRKDFLHLLMQLKDKGRVEDDDGNDPSDKTDNDKQSEKIDMEGDNFVAQSFTFLTAGFETSSTTMTFALYELALHPDVQSRLREEIWSLLDANDGQLTYEAMNDMKYLDMVVAETLRMYPVLPFLDRQAQQPYTLPASKIVLDKGQAVLIPVLGLHFDPEYFPEPDRFDPERFTEENKRKRPNYTYLPFGEGPRSCIGTRMGLMQTKVGLIHLLAHYKVAPNENTPVPMKVDPLSFLLSSKGGLSLNVIRVSPRDSASSALE